MNIAVRPTVAFVDLGAIVSNFRYLSEIAGEGKVCAVIKADAYGHGVGPVAKALEKAGCRRFAVSSLEEGLELRKLGLHGSIIVLFGFPPEHARLAVKNSIVPVVYSLPMLKGYAEVAETSELPVPVHLNFDTGMCRMGMKFEDVEAIANIVAGSTNMRVEGVATHFARAGEPGDFTLQQIERFEQILAGLRYFGVDTGIVHAANSAACLSEPKALYDGVRTGIALYGAMPERGIPGTENLKPALSWSTAITVLREVEAGTPISYGGSFVTRRPSLIATLPVGYADGYRRTLSNGIGKVLVRGERAPVVGRICMDVTMIDVTDIPGVTLGDEAVLIGLSGADRITVEEMADWMGTINYEVLCSIGKRVDRVHHR